jgi:hypothetical protein
MFQPRAPPAVLTALQVSVQGGLHREHHAQPVHRRWLGEKRPGAGGESAAQCGTGPTTPARCGQTPRAGRGSGRLSSSRGSASSRVAAGRVRAGILGPRSRAEPNLISAPIYRFIYVLPDQFSFTNYYPDIFTNFIITCQ